MHDHDKYCHQTRPPCATFLLKPPPPPPLHTHQKKKDPGRIDYPKNLRLLRSLLSVKNFAR